MSVRLTVVDAFTNRPFAGNPAAVCLLPAPADEAWMQQVAAEMNLSETAYLWPVEGGLSLRWFTPTVEVALCGHATLASAHALWEDGTLSGDAPARFHTRSGWLTCRRTGAWIEMDFPAVPTIPEPAPPELLSGLGAQPVATARAGTDWLVELADEEAVRRLEPDHSRLRQLPVRGVIVTAPADAGSAFDFVSRFFAPGSGIDEDPVTGSAHCALGPYWQARLGRNAFTAHQASRRGGVVRAEVRGDRVVLGGQAVTVSHVQLLS